MVVAVLFGLTMGWGLGRILDDLRPPLVAFAAALAVGAVTWAVSTDTSTIAGGGYLVLGCVAGLVGLIPHLRRAH
ncbi:hypothetical protein BH23ACT5_BH23ACT5_12110 [soil metagenome]